jgi:RNA polymerase sigma factor (sigma-70 family)
MNPQFPTLAEERQMVLALKTGDRMAASSLYHSFGRQLYRQVILPRLPVIEQAEDVLRDTFRIALEKIEGYTVVDRSIFFWLRRIAINLVIDTYRKQVRKRELAERILARDAIQETMGTNNVSPDAGLFQADARQLIDLSLVKINERYAMAIRLRLLQDKTREECASSFGITVNNFDVLFHRACKAFRDNYPP